MTNAPAKPAFFEYSSWDVIPVLAGVAHLAYVLALFFLFPVAPWWLLIAMAVIYAISISWNINGISHNFLHNPYFSAHWLNRAFSLMESLTLCFSQAFYEDVHMRHHSGNSDRKDAEGKTIDPLSIYRYSKTAAAENPFVFTFMAFFRDDIVDTYRHLNRKRHADARWGLLEIACVLVMVAAMLVWDWKAVLFMLPFYYVGHSLSSLNGYYEHYNANPDLPIAWGVSSYGRLYNFLWFNNGYHAEHHYRPKKHWTQMKALHAEIADQQRAAGVHVIPVSHALGFLAPGNFRPKNT